MAFRKFCDNKECGKPLGEDGKTFLQLWGSISEQRERPDEPTEFRYLTPAPNSKLAWCGDECENAWKAQQRATRFFRRKPVPQEDDLQDFVIHT